MKTLLNAKFPGTCNKGCGVPIRTGDPIEWERGVGAGHVVCPKPAATQPTLNFTPAAPVVPPVPVVDQTRIVEFLRAAQTRGKLKFPKVRFLAPDGKSELRLSLAGPTSRFPGTVQVKIGYNWIGRINGNGTVTRGITDTDNLLTTLTKIAANPAAAASAYGALMGRCSFCNLPLTDEGSVEVGYGPICAAHYGLPHKAKGTKTVSVVGEVPALPDDIAGDDFIDEHVRETKKFKTVTR